MLQLSESENTFLNIHLQKNFPEESYNARQIYEIFEVALYSTTIVQIILQMKYS